MENQTKKEMIVRIAFTEGQVHTLIETINKWGSSPKEKQLARFIVFKLRGAEKNKNKKKSSFKKDFKKNNFKKKSSYNNNFKRNYTNVKKGN